VYSGISPVGVLITAGSAETREGNVCHVPKLTLVSRLQALLHQGRLKILRSLPDSEVLIRELNDFRVQYTAAGNMGFSARSGRHDDLVLALAIAIWRAEGGGMASWGMWELMRQQATGASTSFFIGLDLGQSRDPTAIAIVRKVDNPAPQDFVEMPVVTREPQLYAAGSVEAARTASTVPPSADWAQRHNAMLIRSTPNHPDLPAHSFEPVNGPNVTPVFAIGSVEYEAEQKRLREKADKPA
jgi:hypothetical protein